MTTTVIVGEKIASARKNKNMMQTDLAKKLSVSPQAIGKWERGESMPDILTFNRMAEILGVDIGYFVGKSQIQETGEQEIKTSEPETKKGFNMSWASWVDADFSGLKGLAEKFKASNIQNCSFVGSDLSNLMLKANNVVKSNFTNAILQNSQFKSSVIRDCNLTNANLSQTVFSTSSFRNNNLTGVTWNNTVFKMSAVIDSTFSGSMTDCQFVNCRLTKIVFSGVTFINCFFKSNQGMKKVIFKDCKADSLTLAFLKNEKADLSGVTLLK